MIRNATQRNTTYPMVAVPIKAIVQLLLKDNRNCQLCYHIGAFFFYNHIQQATLLSSYRRAYRSIAGAEMQRDVNWGPMVGAQTSCLGDTGSGSHEVQDCMRMTRSFFIGGQQPRKEHWGVRGVVEHSNQIGFLSMGAKKLA